MALLMFVQDAWTIQKLELALVLPKNFCNLSMINFFRLSAATAVVGRENESVFPELAFFSQNFIPFGFFAKNLSLGFVITTNNTVSFLSHESS